MRKALALLLLLGLYCLSGHGTVFLYAQEEEEEEPPYEGIPIESDWDGYISDLYSRGDQTFTISLGVTFPTVFLSNGKVIPHQFDQPVGGTGSLAYCYFLNANIFLGGEIGGIFNGTVAKNVVYLIPIGARVGWQFVISRFEFPLYVVTGVAIHRYLDYGYAGFFLKGVASAFFRYNPDWSFGINVDWGWYPQWPMENGQRVPEKNVDGNIFGITLSARYHF